MYSVKWLNKNNLIKLSNNIEENIKINFPRPVFYNELDLLEFDRFWRYPKSDDPLLWANGKQYYYKGEIVASIFGGDIYSKPKLEINKKNIDITPINICELIDQNKKELDNIEAEAKKFIHKAYLRYRDRSVMTVAFSGGKDSQVILDLVTQVIPPSEFISLFTDTGMEIPFTIDTVKHTLDHYSSIYPSFRLLTIRPDIDTQELWRLLGPPSRATRWCCTICKTVPYAKYIKYKKIRSAIDIDGIRESESNQRRLYNRISSNSKHMNIINIHPILRWNTSEIFLYLLKRNIKINKGYRFGLTRIGCAVCPFASKLSEYINFALFPEFMQKYYHIIQDSMIKDNIPDSQIEQFMKEKNWAKIVRNESIYDYSLHYQIIAKEHDLIFISDIDKGILMEWMKVFHKFRHANKDGTIQGSFIYNKNLIKFNINTGHTSLHYVFVGEATNNALINILKRIFNKSIFCIRCRACEMECPSFAITMNNTIKIDIRKCTNCLGCILKYDNGCLNAKSRRVLMDGGEKNKMKPNINRYWGFGFKQEWLTDFLNDSQGFLDSNTLGSIQKKAFICWLRDCNLIDSKNEDLPLIKIVKTISSYSLILQIILVELYYRSTIMRWYLNLAFRLFTRTELLDILSEDFPMVTERTRYNGLSALLGTLDNNWLGDKLRLGIIEKKGNSITTIEKLGTNDIHPAAILYCLYRYAENKEYYDFTLSEIYKENANGTPNRIYGIEKTCLGNLLRSMQHNKYSLIRTEFAANLDNIFLNNEYSAIDALKIALENL